MPANPTNEQLWQSIYVICKVIGQIPCFHLYEEYVATHIKKIELPALRTHQSGTVAILVLVNPTTGIRMFALIPGNSRTHGAVKLGCGRWVG
jgi:hypothetical protein